MSYSRMFFCRHLFSSDKINAFRRCSSQPVLKFSDPALLNYLKHLIVEHDNLYIKKRRTPEESQRLFEIKPIVAVLEKRYHLYDNIVSLKELAEKPSEDKELKKQTIKAETEIYIKHLKEAEAELQLVLTAPKYTHGGVLLEVTANTGGQESLLFARQLYDMYQAYANYRDWAVKVAYLEKAHIDPNIISFESDADSSFVANVMIDIEKSTMDIYGVKKASLLVEGLGVPQVMHLESGLHQAHRIPPNENDGRIHSSTASVLVLRNPTNKEAIIPDQDLIIETKYSCDFADDDMTIHGVRITHTPTGIVVECQEYDSRKINKKIAMLKLRTFLLEKQHQDETPQKNKTAKPLIDSVMIERIRTYDWVQETVIDHRAGSGTPPDLQSFLFGEFALENLHENFIRYYRYQALLNEIKYFMNEYKTET